MLKLLLDEHISPQVADGLRRRDPSLDIHDLAEWEKASSWVKTTPIACQKPLLRI